MKPGYAVRHPNGVNRYEVYEIETGKTVFQFRYKPSEQSRADAQRKACACRHDLNGALLREENARRALQNQ